MQPLSDPERRLLNHVMMWGSDGYPVVRVGRRWHVQDAFGVKGPTTTYKTKREATAQFERWLDMAIERYSLGREES